MKVSPLGTPSDGKRFGAGAGSVLLLRAFECGRLGPGEALYFLGWQTGLRSRLRAFRNMAGEPPVLRILSRSHNLKNKGLNIKASVQSWISG